MAKKVSKKQGSARAVPQKLSKKRSVGSTRRKLVRRSTRRPRGKDSPVACAKSLNATVYGADGWNYQSEITQNPSHRIIDAAIRRLDRFRYPFIFLFLNDHGEDPQEDCLVVMGGRGAYFIDLNVEDHVGLTLFYPDAPDEEVQVWESDQGSSYSARDVTSDIELVLRIVRHFADSGGPLPDAPWATWEEKRQAQLPGLGQTVVIAREVKLAGVAGKLPVGTPLRVEKIEGDHYCVSREGEEHRIHRGDLMSLEDGLDHFACALIKNRHSPDYDAHKKAADFNSLGALWCAKGEFDAALESFDEAIRADRKCAPAYTNRAWLRATCPDDRYRKGAKAVKDASRACELTSWADHAALDALAAALAETRKFAEAIRQQQSAIEMAPRRKKAAYTARLKLYRTKTAYRSPRGAP